MLFIVTKFATGVRGVSLLLFLFSPDISTQAVFESIRDARAKLVAEREAIIAKRLDKRLSKIREKYNRRHRRQMGKAPWGDPLGNASGCSLPAKYDQYSIDSMSF